MLVLRPYNLFSWNINYYEKVKISLENLLSNNKIKMSQFGYFN